MPAVPLEELLLQNPDAPTNDEYAVHLARQLFPRLEERDTAAHLVLVLGLADGQPAAAKPTTPEWSL